MLIHLYFVPTQRYYFVCAGTLGGLLSFASTDDGWEYLVSKEWTRDVQIATQHYKGVSGDCHMTSPLLPFMRFFLQFSPNIPSLAASVVLC